MKFYRYWVKCQRDLERHDLQGNQQRTVVYGHSDYSLDGARECGGRLLDLVQQRIANDGEAPRWSYETEERPIREEVLRTLTPLNVVTRNRYGAEVLNSADLVFVDVDGELPRSKSIFVELLQELFFRNAPSQGNDDALERVVALAERAGCGNAPIRVYRTRAGYRLIIDCVLEGKDSGKLRTAFRADRLYAPLCRVQNCYRARLTPKPYRIRLPKCQFNYPETDQTILTIQQNWLKNYYDRSKRYAVCHYLGSLNAPEGLSGHSVIRHHDECTGAMTDLPLA